MIPAFSDISKKRSGAPETREEWEHKKKQKNALRTASRSRVLLTPQGMLKSLKRNKDLFGLSESEYKAKVNHLHAMINRDSKKL